MEQGWHTICDMSTATLAIVYGLAAALVWGAGDFSGGLAAKRTNVYVVVLLAHVIGWVMMLALALLFGEPLPIAIDWLWGGLAGLGGMMGVLLFYTSLARTSMGVVAPIAAVSTTLLPTAIGIVQEGLPSLLTLAGFALAVVAIWFLAGAGSMEGVTLRDLWLPALAGLGFAFFIIFIDRVQAGSVFWPLVAARTASVSALAIFLLARRQRIGRMDRQAAVPIVGSGVFDAGGNALLALATQAGRLDIASMLSSLYPASTVLLARVFLGERLTRMQMLGVGLALVALILIAG